MYKYLGTKLIRGKTARNVLSYTLRVTKNLAALKINSHVTVERARVSSINFQVLNKYTLLTVLRWRSRRLYKAPSAITKEKKTFKGILIAFIFSLSFALWLFRSHSNQMFIFMTFAVNLRRRYSTKDCAHDSHTTSDYHVD